MKNFMRIAALALCLLMIVPSALAQDVVYRVGEPSRGVFADAFLSGKLVKAQVEMDLELDMQTLGVSAEETEAVQAVLDTLAQSKLTIGAGLTGEGVRAAVEAEMTDAAGANPVTIYALADVTLDGIALESDVIPGKRMSIKWETLLALCGVPQSDIDMIMSLKGIDPDQAIEMLEEALETALEELEPMLNMAAQLAAPYAQTVAAFVQTLPVEVKENLTEEDYPPTAVEVSVTITEKDLGTLLGQLCSQLDADASLKIMLNSLLEQADAGVSIEEFLDEMNAIAAGWTGTDTPITLYLGMNEDGVPMYAEVYIYNEPSGESVYGGLFLYQDADGVWVAEAIGGAYDAEGNAYGSGYLGGSYLGDPADPNVCALLIELLAMEGENPLMEMNYTMSIAAAENGELPAYDTEASMSMYINDGEESVQMVQGTQGRQSLTAAGGEAASTSSTVDTYVEGMALSQTQTLEQLVEPTADGGVTGYTKVSQTMPATGVKKLDMTVSYASENIDMVASRALEQIALETVTDEQMDELLEQVGVVLLEQKISPLMNILPQPAAAALQEALNL